MSNTGNSQIGFLEIPKIQMKITSTVCIFRSETPVVPMQLKHTHKPVLRRKSQPSSASCKQHPGCSPLSWLASQQFSWHCPWDHPQHATSKVSHR